MKFKEYIDIVNKFVENNPESLDLILVSSSDPEGNSFHPVHFGPGIGFYDSHDFTPQSQMKESGYENEKPNAVCLN